MENTSPHSALAVSRVAEAQKKAGHYNRKTGAVRMPPRPTQHQVAILRRIARGWLQITLEERGDSKIEVYTYDDGAPIRDVKGHALKSIARFVNNGWIVPVKGESLIEGGPAQRYVVPKP